MESADETVPNMVDREFPMAVRAPMAATDTKAAIRPYSMAVAPLSSFTKREMRVIMINSNLALRFQEIYAAPALRYGEFQRDVAFWL